MCAVVCDPLSKGECVPAFTHESERGPFVPEVLKTVWTMCWKRWYDCVSCAFHSFFEDEKESRIKGWRRKRRRSRHFCPQCGQLTGISAQSVVASFEGNFRAVGVLEVTAAAALATPALYPAFFFVPEKGSKSAENAVIPTFPTH